MARYEVTMENNVVTDIAVIEDDEEMLGIEWALAEVRETYNHSKVVTASFTLANEDEVDDFLDSIPDFFEADHDTGADGWRDFRAKLGTG
ncbi:MAG: hypothetical protein OXH94_09610 [Rhodospirillales bacterium]|nr:hypothetical protein [Rhodospirillales bacterium]